MTPRPIPPCPYCREARQVQLIGVTCFCQTCGKSWIPDAEPEDVRDLNGTVMNEGD